MPLYLPPSAGGAAPDLSSDTGTATAPSSIAFEGASGASVAVTQTTPGEAATVTVTAGGGSVSADQQAALDANTSLNAANAVASGAGIHAAEVAPTPEDLTLYPYGTIWIDILTGRVFRKETGEVGDYWDSGIDLDGSDGIAGLYMSNGASIFLGSNGVVITEAGISIAGILVPEQAADIGAAGTIIDLIGAMRASGLMAQPPDTLAFAVDPTAALVGAVIAPAVTVHVLDDLGAFCSRDNATAVTLTLTSPGGATLGGTITQSANGVATFDDLTVDIAGTYTLTASSGALSGDESASFVVSAP